MYKLINVSEGFEKVVFYDYSKLLEERLCLSLKFSQHSKFKIASNYVFQSFSITKLYMKQNVIIRYNLDIVVLKKLT